MIHQAFDILAALTSLALTLLVYKWRLRGNTSISLEEMPWGYALALLAGAIIGGYLFGTVNLMLSQAPGIGRSIVGALAGAIVGVELYKLAHGLRGSTGIIFVPALAATVAIGRLGCFFSGLRDFTHGIPTTLPWGHDFGDGIPRHPVQLYESASMALFLLVALLLLARRNAWFMRNGFYVLVLYYAGQRFLWEFLKPYGTLLGPFNVFHLVCLGLMAYALVMLSGSSRQAFTPRHGDPA